MNLGTTEYDYSIEVKMLKVGGVLSHCIHVFSIYGRSRSLKAHETVVLQALCDVLLELYYVHLGRFPRDLLIRLLVLRRCLLYNILGHLDALLPLQPV